MILGAYGWILWAAPCTAQQFVCLRTFASVIWPPGHLPLHEFTHHGLHLDESRDRGAWGSDASRRALVGGSKAALDSPRAAGSDDDKYPPLLIKRPSPHALCPRKCEQLVILKLAYLQQLPDQPLWRQHARERKRVRARRVHPPAAAPLPAGGPRCWPSPVHLSPSRQAGRACQVLATALRGGSWQWHRALWSCGDADRHAGRNQMALWWW